MKLDSELLGNQDKNVNILDYLISTTWEKKVCHFFTRETNHSLVLHSNRQSSPEALLRDWEQCNGQSLPSQIYSRCSPDLHMFLV